MARFDKSKFNEEIVLFNEYIAKGFSTTAAEREMGYKKGSFWSHVKNKCIKNETTGMYEVKSPTDVGQVSEMKQKPVKSKKSDICPIAVAQPNNLILEVDNNQLKEDLLALGGRYKEIDTMLEWFKNKQSDNSPTEVIQVIDEGIKIELPDNKELKKISVWTNQEIWEQFGEFCKDHGEFTKGDLLSMALISYMKQYK